MAYVAYWREVGGSEWNEVHSESPITWTQELEKGKCTGAYRVTAYVYREQRKTYWWLPGYVEIVPQYYESTVTINGPIQGWTTDGAGYLCVIGTLDGSPYTVRTGLPGEPWPCVTNPNGWQNCSGGIVRIERPVGSTLPDDCGDCITTFSTGLIVTKPQCIEVTLIPPECPCCSEMLPIATRILTTLEGMVGL